MTCKTGHYCAGLSDSSLWWRARKATRLSFSPKSTNLTRSREKSCLSRFLPLANPCYLLPLTFLFRGGIFSCSIRSNMIAVTSCKSFLIRRTTATVKEICIEGSFYFFNVNTGLAPNSRYLIIPPWLSFNLSPRYLPALPLTSPRRIHFLVYSHLWSLSHVIFVIPIVHFTFCHHS